MHSSHRSSLAVHPSYSPFTGSASMSLATFLSPGTTHGAFARKLHPRHSAVLHRSQASSGKTNRHRLSRGGARTANRALWRIVLTRMRTERTREYLARRQAEGKSKREVVRCLKRYVAGEIYHVLQRLGPGVLAA